MAFSFTSVWCESQLAGTSSSCLNLVQSVISFIFMDANDNTDTFAAMFFLPDIFVIVYCCACPCLNFCQKLVSAKLCNHQPSKIRSWSFNLSEN